jgi:Lrp/AsnC family transcriptional regulator, leucine-responsive regulatory protein
MVDEIDRQIIALLRQNGRLTHEQIGREVNLSRPAVHERVRRLEEKGIIRGYTATFDWTALGYPLTALIWVRIADGRSRDSAQAMLRMNSDDAFVEECYRITGEWCLLLKARVTSPLALQDLIDRIRESPGVQATMTMLALSAVSEDVCKTDAVGDQLKVLQKI